MTDTSKKRSAIQIEYDRKEIARRYLQGETQAAIAESMGLAQQMISYDLARVREAWLKSSLVEFNEIRARELARIDIVEQEYWQAWRASMAERTVKRKDEKRIGAGEGIAIEVKLQQRIEQRDGNPAFLAGIQWCIEQRCKIFGLYEPERFALVDWRAEAEEQGVNAGSLFEQLVNNYVAAIAASDGTDDSGSVDGSAA